MAGLVTTPNIDDPDGFYAELLALHDDLEKTASDRVNARLILTLANHIGDRAVLSEAMRLVAEPGDQISKSSE